MAVWVLESAYRYARSAAILQEAQLTFESEVNAALAMELLIKSLLVVPEQNARFGTVAQQYSVPPKSRRQHDLVALLDLVPKSVADEVGLNGIRDGLEIKKDVFMKMRYIYEPSAPKGSSDFLLGYVCWTLPQVVDYFFRSGSTDPWLLYMKKHPEKMMQVNIAKG